MLKESNTEYNLKLQEAFGRNLAEIAKRKTKNFNISFEQTSEAQSM